MKNLANCKPSEFMKQTNRIRKATEKWLGNTKILEIRKNLPEIELPPLDASAEEKARIMAENDKKREEQVRKNLSKMLDAIMDDYPQETLDLMALLCFVEPENVDDHEMSEYIEAITEMLSNKAVLGFFTSLARVGQMNI